MWYLSYILLFGVKLFNLMYCIDYVVFNTCSKALNTFNYKLFNVIDVIMWYILTNLMMCSKGILLICCTAKNYSVKQ